MVKKFLIFLSFFACIVVLSPAQSYELNCNVNIDWSNVNVNPGDKTLLTELKTVITNFMNNRKWTNDVYNPEERIKCNIYITIKNIPAYGVFEATASIQASRPVYGSSYETTTLNFFDKKFNFEYNPSLQMDFNENTFFNNLTSSLGFYAYVILGMDYDSFSKLGGSPWFEKARNIANVAQTSGGGDAWMQNDPTGRYSLIDNINNQQFTPMREGMYLYHRQALDKFTENAVQGRKDIIEVLKKIKLAQQYNPSSILIRSFFLAKMNELINIFKEAPSDVKNQSVELLSQLDPVNAEKYSTKILNR
jgi:hypothetical protein